MGPFPPCLSSSLSRSRDAAPVALAAEPSRHLHPLEDARGRCRRADRAGGPDVVRPVAGRPAVEAVPLDRPGEALADRDPGHLDRVPRLEGLDGDRLAHGQLRRAAQLDEVPVSFGIALLQVAELALRELALLDRLAPELGRL